MTKPRFKYPEGQTGFERRRDYKLRLSFGITLAEYNTMWRAQDGVCAICGKPETKFQHGRVYHLSVDHDHVTDRIRGLLCYACNTGMGKLGDSPKLLRKALVYLTAGD